MKLIIKNDNRDIVKNPNVKIIETTEASFTNQTVFIEENDVPIIKYTDTESMYFVKDLDNLYDRKSKSEVLLDITIDNLELIGGGSSEPVDSRPYKVYTALLSQTGTDAPVATVLENTLGDIQFGYSSPGQYIISSEGLFLEDLTYCFINNSNDGDFIGSPHLISKAIVDTSTIGFTVTLPNTGIPENSFLYKTEIEIRVYN